MIVVAIIGLLAAIAILVLYCLPYASDWYVSVAGYGFSGLFFRALLCIAFLLPPTVLTLEAARPRSGKVLHYQQFVHPKGEESVSFAAAAFYE